MRSATVHFLSPPADFKGYHVVNVRRVRVVDPGELKPQRLVDRGGRRQSMPHVKTINLNDKDGPFMYKGE